VNEPVTDLVVLSHLRWPWVWQRPQHLVSRLARRRTAAGGRTWFVEEPTAGDVTAPQLQHEQRDGLTRIWLVVPAGERAAEVHSFDAAGGENYGELLAALLAEQGSPPGPDVWLYTPTALAIVDRLTFGGNIIETGTSSYRLAHARTQRQSAGATSSPVTLGPSRVDTARRTT